jgi:hypothetical protein
MRTLKFQRIVIALSICALTTCASPRDKSQQLTRQVFEQLPVPAGATLLFASEYENISKTGMGTYFGFEGLYGSDAEYDHVFEEYRGLLAARGWQEYDFGNRLRFCNPDYKAVDIGIANLAGFEEYYDEMLAEVSDEEIQASNTLFIVRVSHYPFDSPGFCGMAD